MNSVGSITPPGYEIWVKKAHDMPGTAWSMITLVWLAWFMNQFLLLIILLNFINATFGASNEQAMSKMDSHRVFIRASMNRECFLILRALNQNHPVDSMIIKYPDQPPKDTRWHGYTRTILRCIENQTKLLRGDINSTITNYNVKK